MSHPKNHPVHPVNPVQKEVRQDEHDLQDMFADSVKAIIRTHSSQSRTLAQLRDALLPKLLSGELSVPAAQTKTEEALT